MNVKDFPNPRIPTGDRLLEMINQQKSLMEKYHHIERNFRFTPDCPIDLDDRHGQLLLKDFAWRTTEELAEALDALDGTPNGYLHAQEEVADALHFLLELYILADGPFGCNINHFYQPEEPIDGCVDSLDILFKEGSEDRYPYLFSAPQATMNFISKLGMVCHCLKNKPWKQSHMLTDKHVFYDRLRDTLLEFANVARCFDLDAEALYQMYFRKAQVNQFRQRSNY